MVRIPRDWFGPKDDLVPFGPRAGADHAAEAPLDAETFWGEDADSVHDVLDGRPGVAAGPSVRHTGRWALVAAILALLMTGAGLATWLPGSSQRRPGSPQIASTTNPYAAATRLLQKRAAAINREPRMSIRRHPRTPRHRGAATRATRPTQVVYHPVQQSAPSPSTNSTAAASADAAPSPTAGSQTAAQPASSPQVSQPAFGANGALGPMSSPAG